MNFHFGRFIGHPQKPGNLTHLSGELFRMMTGIKVVHVPYRGTPAHQLDNC
jgi:tripartite-type tricarboxylate transporter receptor subunit TctC